MCVLQIRPETSKIFKNIYIVYSLPQKLPLYDMFIMFYLVFTVNIQGVP